jgi:hypothetical protein
MTQNPNFHLRLEVGGTVEYQHPVSGKILIDEVIYMDYKTQSICIARKSPHSDVPLGLNFSQIINAYPL